MTATVRTVPIQVFLEAKGKAFREAFGDVHREVFGHSSRIREQEQEQDPKQERDLVAYPETQMQDVDCFLDKFCAAYSTRRGAKYFVRRKNDVPNVRRLLETYGPEALGRMVDLLLTVDDTWISNTDRGIGILAHKASWLQSRLPVFESHQASSWGKVLERLAEKIPRHPFERWWGGTRELRREGKVVVVGIESSDHLAWVQRHYAAELDGSIT